MKINNKLWIGIIVILFIAIFSFGIYIRTQNISQLTDITTNEYTLAPDLDPFLFLRHAEEINEGRLNDIDMMRKAPLGVSNFAKVNMMSWSIFYIYKIFKLESITYSAIIAPVIFFAITLIIFFFFVFKLFSFIMDKKRASIVALISSLLYIISLPMLHRTLAGIPELESLGMLWFFSALLCFICCWDNKSNRKIVIYSLMTGLFTSLMMFTWGGYRYLFLIIPLTTFIMFLFNKDKNKNLLLYSLWLILPLISLFLIAAAINIFLIVFALGILAILLVDKLISKIKLKDKIKLPQSIISLIITMVFGIIVLFIINPSYITQASNTIINGLLYPFGKTTVGVTVSENRIPYVTEVFSSFGILFWFFFFGSILLFYETIKHFNNVKIKRYLLFVFSIFLFTFIFSKFAPNSILNGENFVSQFMYFGGLILFIVSLAFIYIKSYLKNDEQTIQDFKDIKFFYIFMLSFIFWMTISMRGAIRLFFIISPLLIMIAAYLPVKLSEYKPSDSLYKMLQWCIIFSLAVFLLVTIITNAQVASQQSKYTIPGPYQWQWQKCMSWVRENTANDSIFISWWDYGYWIQTLGQRATVTDGGHANGYWDFTTSRYLLNAKEEKTALQLCNVHNASYLLLDSTDIGKYPAYSSIASVDSDRTSWISVFVLNDKQTMEFRNGTQYIYTGGTHLDADIIWNGIIYPKNKAVIGGFIITEDENQTIVNVNIIIFYNNRQQTIPIRYIFLDKKYDLGEDKIESLLYLFPRLDERGINYRGAGMYLPQRVLNSQFARLYLLNETTGFELVHKEPSFIIADIENRHNIKIGDLLYTNQIEGSINIYKINLFNNIKYYEEYLDDKYQNLDNLGV